MTTTTLKLYPSAPLENNDFEERWEKNMGDTKSFGNSIKNKKRKITYLKDKNQKLEKSRKTKKHLLQYSHMCVNHMTQLLLLKQPLHL